MAKLVYGLNQSLDGYVDRQQFAPGPTLFRHFIEQVRDLTSSVYGRRMYEQSLTELGLVDEHQLYLHPIVDGRGKPFFAGPRPPLRLVSSTLIGEDTTELTYVPA